jgi:hypothetical protein
MTYQKIYSGRSLRNYDVITGALPGGNYVVGSGYGVDQDSIKIGSATAIDRPLPYKYVGLGTTGRVVKAYNGKLILMQISNVSASVCYVKIYNKATAPTSADTPVFTYAISGNQNIQMNLDEGVMFDQGISLRASTGAADNDNTAPGANDIIVNATYR